MFCIDYSWKEASSDIMKCACFVLTWKYQVISYCLDPETQRNMIQIQHSISIAFVLKFSIKKSGILGVPHELQIIINVNKVFYCSKSFLKRTFSGDRPSGIIYQLSSYCFKFETQRFVKFRLSISKWTSRKHFPG